MKQNLTELTIAQLHSESQLDVYDTIQPRFGIRVSKKGKTYFVFAGTPRRRIQLGRYPDVSLKSARTAAKRYLLDPATFSTRQTLSEAFQLYLQKHVHPNYRPRTRTEVERLVPKHCGHLFRKPIANLKSTDFIPIFDKMPPSEANHLFGVLRTFFNWAEKRDACISPLKKLSKPTKEKSRSRILSDAEIIAIWDACDNDSFGSLVRFLILCGQRRGESAATKPVWITDNVLTFPKEVTKNGQEHSIPLAAGAATLISQQLHKFQSDQPAKLSSQIVFPSSKTGNVITGFAKLKEALDKRSGVKDYTLHDLRRTWATRSADLGTPPHVIEKCLNHLTGTITPLGRTYNRALYLEECRAAMDRYDAHIRSLIAVDAT